MAKPPSAKALAMVAKQLRAWSATPAGMVMVA
jgi:hypothetical protein